MLWVRSKRRSPYITKKSTTVVLLCLYSKVVLAALEDYIEPYQI